LTKDSGEVLVTEGRHGGVGSVAVAILGKLGFNVVAATEKRASNDFLRALD
jgi:acrylyl-CoA reductase (NADPH)